VAIADRLPWYARGTGERAVTLNSVGAVACGPGPGPASPRRNFGLELPLRTDGYLKFLTYVRRSMFMPSHVSFRKYHFRFFNSDYDKSSIYELCIRLYQMTIVVELAVRNALLYQIVS